MKTIRQLCALAIFGLLSLSSLASDSPEVVVQKQMAAMRAGDWDSFTVLMHGAALSEFQTSLLSMLGAAPVGEKRDEMLTALFGGKSVKELTAMKSAAFFTTFMTSLSNINPMMKKGMEGTAGETLGHVDEGPDKAHVVTRMTVTMGEMKVTKMEVTTLQRDGDTWKAVLNGDMQSMIAGMIRTFKAK